MTSPAVFSIGPVGPILLDHRVGRVHEVDAEDQIAGSEIEELPRRCW